MLVLQTTPQGRHNYELPKDALFSNKSHQGGLNNPTDESDGQMFEVIDSSRCPVKTSLKKRMMPGPGFEPGLLRPQRSVLTTRRSRLTILPTAGRRKKIMSYTSNSTSWIYRKSCNFCLEYKVKLCLVVMFLKIRSCEKKLYLS